MKPEKLGRNPFDKSAAKSASSATSAKSSSSFIAESKLDRIPLVEKFQELGLEVDWEEFIKSTVGTKIQKLSRYFLR